MKKNLQTLILCMRRAHALGYKEIGYTELGFNLMKRDRTVRSFRELEELDRFLRTAQERWVNLGQPLNSIMNIR